MPDPVSGAPKTDESPSFFRSRWVEVPDSVVAVDPRGLPKGFRAAGVAAGIKPSGGTDVALLVCDEPGAVSAARFTRSGTAAPPVLVTRQESRLDALRAVVVTSGNANAGTGRDGFETARQVRAAAARATGVDEDQVAVCATGVIGVPLPMDVVPNGIAAAGEELRADGDDDFRRGIETTDLFPKTASLTVRLDGGDVTLHAVCKGAGMIQPSFATMLCFVTTDARLQAETADLLLGVCVKRSFDRISVDGQLSTSDTAVLIASGASGVEVAPGSPDEQRLGLALDALLRQLAVLIAKDGEGARRVGRVVVRGPDGPACERVARQVANSPLVKTALYGGDPNWGRIVQAVGAVIPGPAFTPVGVRIEGIEVCRDGQEAIFDRDALAVLVSGPEVEYEITVGRAEQDAAAPQAFANETEVFFSDLGHEYVTLNAEYTT
ncbi:bifunctional glutamate N-acetyltransferase/amino-acid acetyltransferase ArgJ [Patulibacter sp. SYSU D01012]|uniref:bifunctional glutamate N-acetyltransferase/amino-acid acetyltransferase ArgJ n=1 Tax=Patulibacter sp. SYSU D01012 TaxID=2817381 RepID=UPI001B318188|nr:bifunctional glutamate N-acetyltransferase/amino-acid acetyltransferase ArgJ [Patulibacter sp. SYSU D01012]